MTTATITNAARVHKAAGWAAQLGIHGSAALIASSTVTLIIVAILGRTPLKPVLEFGGMANPVFWASGFVLGFLINRGTQTWIAALIWIGGLVWLAFGIWDSVRLYDPRFYQGCSAADNVVNAFFIMSSQRCGGGESTLAGILFTLPAVNSAAYGAGAWLSLRLRSSSVKSPLA